jgi:hypothetical protein
LVDNRGKIINNAKDRDQGEVLETDEAAIGTMQWRNNTLIIKVARSIDNLTCKRRLSIITLL